jgi:hypothetical protein
MRHAARTPPSRKMWLGICGGCWCFVDGEMSIGVLRAAFFSMYLLQSYLQKFAKHLA